ncbi:hypothetical protein GH714_027719 [Hevea brasiliensis]|uniref:GED domain-containing protein n=1 Tax=Hevea brasiliensis TaxID=3981 RepID=A0A6A6ME73_HEVBR|nr:hypothetical protein GH714_027719 [Hevea brasiliensis]
MPKTLSSPAEAMTTFMGIVRSAEERLRQILIRGEYDEYLDDHHIWVTKIVQMEKMTYYTCNPDYMSEWNKLMSQQDTFRDKILTQWYSKAEIESIRDVEARNLRAYQNVLHQAFDLKMRMTAYWKVVLRRLVLVDSMALHLQFSVQNLVNKEMEKEIISELTSNYGGSIERMLEESTQSLVNVRS